MTIFLRRRALLTGSILGLSGVVACSSVPRNALKPGEPSAPLQPDEGLALISFRRFVKADCRDGHYESFNIIHEDRSPPGRLWSNHPNNGSWQPDPVRPNVIRYVLAMRLKAGRHAFSDYTYRTGNSYVSPATAPFPFTVTAGQATYIGGIGIMPEYTTAFGCHTDRGTLFYFSDFKSDRSLFLEWFPSLSMLEMADRSSLPREWRRGPEGFD